MKDKPHSMIFVMLLFFFVFIDSQTIQTDCTRIEDGVGSYNLQSIVGQELTFAEGPNLYKVSVCQNAYSTCGGCMDGAGWCKEYGMFKDCVGKFSLIVPLVVEEGVELVYDRGDYGMMGRIIITCDPNVGDLDSVESFDPYTKITAKSRWACRNVGTISPGTVICITIVVMASVYLVGGIAYNKFYREKSGVEMIPNYEFWQDIPFLFRDGVIFVVSKVKDLLKQS